MGKRRGRVVTWSLAVCGLLPAGALAQAASRAADKVARANCLSIVGSVGREFGAEN